MVIVIILSIACMFAFYHFLKSIFESKEGKFPYENLPIVVESSGKLTEEQEENEWISIEDELPPHEVVLGACDTYDCGWIMECVWWNVNEQCWMNNSEVTRLHYTHWRKLPPEPKFTMWDSEYK